MNESQKRVMYDLENIKTDLTLKIGELQYKIYRLIEDRHTVIMQMEEKKREYFNV